MNHCKSNLLTNNNTKILGISNKCYFTNHCNSFPHINKLNLKAKIFYLTLLLLKFLLFILIAKLNYVSHKLF